MIGDSRDPYAGAELMSEGDIRRRQKVARNDAQAQADAAIRTAMESPHVIPGGGGGGGAGNLDSLLELLLGAGAMPVNQGFQNGAGGGYADLRRRANSSLTAVQGDKQKSTRLQNAILGEQLESAQFANAQAKSKKGGASFGEAMPGRGSLGGGMGGGGFNRLNDMVYPKRPNRNDRRLERDERGRDMALDRSDYEARLRFEHELEQENEAQDQERKMALFRAILGRFGGSQTSTGTSTTSGGEYQNIAGRPVYMPTSSTTNTSQTKPLDRMELFRLLDL